MNSREGLEVIYSWCDDAVEFNSESHILALGSGLVRLSLIGWMVKMALVDRSKHEL